MAEWPAYAGANFADVMGSVPAASGPTTLTSGAAHTKGAYVSLLNNVPSEYCGVIVQYGGLSATTRLSIDLAIGPAGGGSEQVVIPDLLTWENRLPISVWFPLAIPAGCRVSARCQSLTASATARIVVQGIPATPRMPSGLSGATNYGFVAATTAGAALDCGAVANTDVVTELSASVSSETKCFYLQQTQNVSPTASADLLVDLGMWDGSTAGSFVSFADDCYFRATNAAYTFPYIVGPFFGNWPSGFHLAARGRCSSTDAGARTLYLSALGFN